MKRRDLVFAGLCLAAFAPAGRTAPASGKKLLEAFSQRTRSASGRFVQRITDASGQVLDAGSRGEFVFARPGRFVWRIAEPYPQTIVSNGQTLWIWDPDLNQVTTKKVGGAIDSTPAGVLFGRSAIGRFFTIGDLPADGALVWAAATAKDEDSPYGVIEVAFDGQGTIAAMRLKDHFGQTTELTFSEVKLDPIIDTQMFEFQIPKGADVLADDNP